MGVGVRADPCEQPVPGEREEERHQVRRQRSDHDDTEQGGAGQQQHQLQVRRLVARDGGLAGIIQNPLPLDNRYAGGPIPQLSGIRIDVESHRAWMGDEELHLTAKEFDLLRVLVRDAGRDMQDFAFPQRDFLTCHEQLQGPLQHVGHLFALVRMPGDDRAAFQVNLRHGLPFSGDEFPGHHFRDFLESNLVPAE